MLQASDWWRSSWNKSSIIVRKEKKGMSKWNLILDSIILPQTDLLSNTSTNKTANANKNTVRQKYKEGERNVEMKSYLGLSHSPPGLLSNTFCRRRWWEREMTNVKEEEEDRAIDFWKLYISDIWINSNQLRSSVYYNLFHVAFDDHNPQTNKWWSQRWKQDKASQFPDQNENHVLSRSLFILCMHGM